MPSINALSTALLACAGSAVATQFTLADTYDHTNFFQKFTFTDDPDTNSGFVTYQNLANAQSQGLAKITSDNEVYLGVDHQTVLKGSGYPGRNSLRLESTDSYKHGLIVARFTHLPANKCGSWPSFWTLGENWPSGGEIDVYEGWNNILDNQPAFHVGSSSQYGQCILQSANQSAPVATSNCDNTFQSPPSQYLNQGCTATDSTGPWASPSGGTYAIEWTSDYIKLYNWARGAEPANLATSNPDTATWGTPVANLENSNCNIDSHFGSQRLILDIDFCGNPVGTPAYWQQSCAATTGQGTCADYVAKFPGDFAESYFQIQDIRYFSQSTAKPTTSKVVSSKATSSKAAVSTSKAAATSEAASSSAVVVPTSVISSQSAAAAGSSAGSSAAAVTGTVVATSRWSNSSVTATGAGSAISSAAQLTTSTVFTTSVHTISQCPPEVTNCPFRPTVTTETIALYTTICPVLAAESSSELAAHTTAAPAPPAGSAGVPSGPETITTDITVVHTITSCAADITNCPARVTTQVIRTSYPAGQQTGVPVVPSSPVIPAVPISPAGSPSNAPGSAPSIVPVVPVGAPSNAPGSAPSIVPVVPVGAPSNAPGSAPSIVPVVPVGAPSNVPSAPGSGAVNTWASSIVGVPTPVGTGSSSAATGQPPAPASSGLGGCTGADCLSPIGNGAQRSGLSTLALVGALAAMLL